MMDIFCEYLVQKKSSADTTKKLLIKVACGVVLVISFFFLFIVFGNLAFLLPVIWGATIYGTVILCRNYSIEYEYVFTNGQLDIDVIKGRSKRSNLVSIACKNIEHMESYTQTPYTDRKIVDAIYDESRRGKYYVDYTKDGERIRLLFQPPEKILTNMKKYNPRNVNL